MKFSADLASSVADLASSVKKGCDHLESQSSTATDQESTGSAELSCMDQTEKHRGSVTNAGQMNDWCKSGK